MHCTFWYTVYKKKGGVTYGYDSTVHEKENGYILSYHAGDSECCPTASIVDLDTGKVWDIMTANVGGGTVNNSGFTIKPVETKRLKQSL